MNMLNNLKAGIGTSALPIAILALVMLMVLPMPTTVLDLGFITNIMVSLAVLMVALNAAKPLDFSAFPTVLLFATIFRLALNVASTRVVLVDGHGGSDAAGHVIEAFGNFLIGGDYIVGLFVFVVLLIINLVVISKGAGRISEVSARFTLDALPGKQMAIDADLNAGLITVEEAKLRRHDVTAEADFYGSMDGASKFVKGDAFAGLLILFVNIIGGLVLGTVKHGLSFSDAAETYIVLAIGDALVAQVPALLLSIAAAAIVTRVTSPLDLNGQIGSQFSSSKVWGPVAAILVILAVLPGMPFFAIAPAACFAAFLFHRCRKAEKMPQLPDVAPEEDEKPAHQIDWNEVSENAPIDLKLGYGLVELVDPRKKEPLMARITGIRKQLSRELGFVIPAVRVTDDLSLPANGYRVSIAGVVVGEDEVWPHEMLALDNGDSLEKLHGRPAKDPSFGLDAIWIAPDQKTEAIAAGYTVVDASAVIATHLHNLVHQSAHSLFGLDETQALIDNLKESCPQLAQNLTPQPYTLATVTAVCRSLLEERVPVRDFRRIAEALVECAGQELDQEGLLDNVRQKLGNLIIQTICPIKMPLSAITFDPELEKLLVQSVRSAPGTPWPFDPQLSRRLIECVAEATQPLLLVARSFAIITAPACRAAVARLLRAQLADVPVLSFLEIPESKKIDVIASVGEEEARPGLPSPETTDF